MTARASSVCGAINSARDNDLIDIEREVATAVPDIIRHLRYSSTKVRPSWPSSLKLPSNAIVFYFLRSSRHQSSSPPATPVFGDLRNNNQSSNVSNGSCRESIVRPSAGSSSDINQPQTRSVIVLVPSRRIRRHFRAPVIAHLSGHSSSRVRVRHLSQRLY